MKKLYCEYCMKEKECTYKENFLKETIDGKEIEYLEKYYICNKCKNKIYGEFLDYNINAANNELRKKSGLITIDEILEITKKYNIGKKPLSLVLGLGEITITRYINGQNPTKENSELLKNILNNPFLYEMYLIGNKDKITDVAFKKSLNKTKQLELITEKSSLYNISLYAINRFEGIDQLSLQKILYFIYGFSKPLLGYSLFSQEPESWKYGPVYREIYDCFSNYGYEKINYEELLKSKVNELNNEEKKLIDTILLDFGCYSGYILKEMTHLTDPWIKARKGLTKDDYSNRLISISDIDIYFNNICKKYSIKSINDIEKYSESLFKEAREILKQ